MSLWMTPTCSVLLKIMPITKTHFRGFVRTGIHYTDGWHLPLGSLFLSTSKNKWTKFLRVGPTEIKHAKCVNECDTFIEDRIGDPEGSRRADRLAKGEIDFCLWFFYNKKWEDIANKHFSRPAGKRPLEHLFMIWTSRAPCNVASPSQVEAFENM